MVKGVNKKEFDIIKEILKQYPYEFFFYGSRVKGDYQKGSDLDILIKSDTSISFKILEELDLKFNKSLIPYRVNFCDYNSISADFYNHIKKDLVKI